MKNTIESICGTDFDAVFIDLETATMENGSICQIGLCGITGESPPVTATELINPLCPFDVRCTAIHGLTAETVAEARTFSEVADEMAALAERQIIVSHSFFDRHNLAAALGELGRPLSAPRWYDSTLIVRRTWPEKYARRGYGLENLARDFGITYKAHDAGEDAATAARIAKIAMAETGTTFDDLPDFFRRTKPSSSRYQAKIAIDGDPNGALAGEVCCFTGALTLSRTDAATIAAKSGMTVKNGVTLATTVLIVGTQDMHLMAEGQTLSGKHRKALDMQAKGHPIRIIGEDEFLELIAD